MKVLIIGNSHGSAAQMALRTGWSYPGLDIDIVVVPGRKQPQMRLDGHRIYPFGNLDKLRSNLEGVPDKGLDLTAYQAIWLVGFGLNGPSADEISEGSHVFTRASHVVGSPFVPRVSGQVMRELVALDLQDTGFMSVLRDLAAWAVLPLRVVPRPRPSSALLRRSEAGLQNLYGDHVQAALGGYFGLHDEVIASSVGSKAKILWQPPETLEGLFTADRFMRDHDPTHMTGDYGRRILDQLVQSMKE